MDLPSFIRDKAPVASTLAIQPAALLLVGTVVAWVGYDEYREYAATIDQEYRVLDTHARIAHEHVAERVRHARRALARVAREAPRYRSKARVAATAWLSRLQGEASDVDTLMIASPSGRVELASDPQFVGFYDPQHDSLRRANPETSALNIYAPFVTPSGNLAIAYSMPIRDAAGKLLGMAMALDHHRRLDDALAEARPPADGTTLTILDDSGDILYRYPHSEHVGKNVAANPVFQEHLRSGRSATRGMANSPIDGVERMYAMRGVADYPLSIVVAEPLRDVLAPWRNQLAIRSLASILGAALVLRLVWTAYRRQQEILAGKEFSEQLMETANAMMVVVDSESRVVAVNEATEEITGYARDELVGRSIFDTVMPRERFPRAWTGFLAYREGRQMPRAFEAPILTRNGEERVIAWQNNGVFNHGGTNALLSFGVDVTERAQLQQVRAREEISRRLVGIQEEERRRLAMELHDRTSANLSVLDIKLKMLADALPKDASTGLADLIEDLSATLKDTIASIRSVSLDFRPPLLDYAGLWPALNAYARQFSKRTGITVEIAGPDAPLRPLPEVEVNLFHIAQEALANCARHSHARTVLIRKSCHGDEMILMICDDGVGFDATVQQHGSGLANMRQRAAFIGGKFHIDSHPGKGTCVAIRFPLGPAAAYGEESPDAAASHAAAPSPAARPLEKQPVSR